MKIETFTANVLNNFASMTTTLSRLLKKKISESIETLIHDQHTTFETLKNKIAPPPLLESALVYLPYVLDTAAIDEQI